MSTNWKAGDKAVCVDDAPRKKKYCDGDLIKWPVKGRVYLVESVREINFSDGPMVRLIIATNPVIHNGMEYGWQPDRFRKLVTATKRAEIEQEVRA